MNNPLTPLRDALATIEDSFRIARACALTKNAPPVAGTQFDPPDIAMADVLIGVTRLELEDLFVLAMTASFEARVKEFLKSQIAVTPGSYHARIEKWIHGEVETAPLRGLARIFKPPVTRAMIEDADTIREYRNWVAHGRTRRKPASLVTPSFAYNALTSFMTTSNII